MAHDSPYLRPRDAAAYLGLDEKTLANWRHAGKGPPFIKISHKAVRYRASDIDQWMTSHLIGRTCA